MTELDAATPQTPIRVGRYDVFGPIGRGGMGAVYDAVDREHGARVALKTLSRMQPESLLRFKNEFRSVADLHHENLVQLYELGCHEGIWYFTMERIDGVDFLRWVRGAAGLREPSLDTIEVSRVRPGPLSPAPGGEGGASHVQATSLSRLREATAQLVRGVRALHRASLLHLDLKPANVLVDRSGRVVVLDFGLVRPTIGPPELVPIDTERLEIVGTPAWMSPEQFAGRDIGEASDWYAVGLMLYYALTGVMPFPQSNAAQIWYAKQNVPPIPPDQRGPGVPPDLSALAMGLLNPSPSLRPSGDTILGAASGDETTRERIVRLARPEFVGRDEERERVAAAVDHVRAGGAALVRIAGPSGIGKSALLSSVYDEASASGGVLVLRGRCYERETVPYKAFDGMIDGLVARAAARGEALLPELPTWMGELAQVFPVLARVEQVRARVAVAPAHGDVGIVELRRRAMEALRSLLVGLAAQRPLVLLVDDLQWADADSLAMLTRLFEPSAPPGLLLAMTYRPAEAAASPAVAGYLRGVDVLAVRGDVLTTTIEVGPLAAAQARTLAATTLAALGKPSAAAAAAIAAESGGVPFFVEELARASASSHRREGERLSLEDVLARRVQSLPSSERALLEVLTVANNPIPLQVAFAVARVGQASLRALWSLCRGHFARSTGLGGDDTAELNHDRMREAVLRGLEPSRVEDLHLSLARALSVDEGWLYDAVRHYNAVQQRLDDEERRRVARLDLQAGRRARQAAAFPLAFECFRAGARLLGEASWDTDYELAIALHGGAAETASLSAAWEALDEHVASVKARGRGMLDQLVAWEARIEAYIAQHAYAEAVVEAVDALDRLGVHLPLDPGEAEVGEHVRMAMEGLARVGTGLVDMPAATDPTAVAAMRILSRVASAAYFARPMLLPVIACRLVVTSVEHGPSPATPYALAVYGIVLNTLGLRKDAHGWGRVALEMIHRFDDRSLEARTRHVIHDLVCVWTVPLASTLPDLRAVIAVGRDDGDLEYAAYAAHAWVHNSFYAGSALGPLLDEALALGRFLRGYGQVNALHVHVPFEQVLRCFTGRAANPASLDGEGFREQEAIATAPSRSVACLVPLLMGVVRYHFATVDDAIACLEQARPFLDGLASTWHVPIFHQYAALALYSRGRPEDVAAADESLAVLRDLAKDGPANFAHRVAMLEGARARATGDAAGAWRLFAQAVAKAERWPNDLALAHELAATVAPPERARGHREAARLAYARWGAQAKVDRLTG